MIALKEVVPLNLCNATKSIFKCHYRAAVFAQMISRRSSSGFCNSELNFYIKFRPSFTSKLMNFSHNILAVGTTAYTIQVTDSRSWMLTMMVRPFPSQRPTPPRTHQGRNTHIHATIIIVPRTMAGWVQGRDGRAEAVSRSWTEKYSLMRHKIKSTFMDHPSLTGAVWESIIKTVEIWRGWKTQVSVDSKQHVHVVWVYSVYRSLVSFSDTVPAAKAHAAKCSGFSERVAQNSARHCLLHCWCEHLHCEFTAFLALLFFNFKSSSSFYKQLLHSQNTLLAFTVSGIFKEGELCSSRLSSCTILMNW